MNSITSRSVTEDLALHGIRHEYAGVVALHGIDLDIAGGSFVTLLGPSGCGKTTLLRAIAGFVCPTSGTISLGGRDLTRTPPHKRPFNMVFQRPTLFPHLDVFGNVAFGLRLAKVPRRTIAARVDEALELMRLGDLRSRRSHELSGGQMQRVALARALVNRPSVLMLDEPLSALDLKIRLELEVELRRVHRETGATWIYVTHDQREALALSDQIAVFDHGRIEQLGPPDEIYCRPSTPYVARFVGDANVIPVDVSLNGTGPCVELGGVRVPTAAGNTGTGPAWLVVRSESMRLARHDAGGAVGTLRGVVRDVAFRGAGISYRVAIDGVDDLLKVELAGVEHDVQVGETVTVGWEPEAGTLLQRSG